MKVFWIVCKDVPELKAYVRHETREAAEAEAERLCRKTRDAFLIFEVFGRCEVQDIPVAWEVASL